MSQGPPSSTGDDLFGEPIIDVDEWRGAPVRHRYVHGAFAGTLTRFSIYLPPSERYEGRFFQHITPVPDSENLAQIATGEEDRIGFSIASGAYFLETNGGGTSGTPGSDVDPTIAAYRANAAAAEFSRVVAAQMYGEHRPHGYAYGGSGGGIPHHRRRREHRRRLGRRRPLRHRISYGHPEHVHRPHARHAGAPTSP